MFNPTCKLSLVQQQNKNIFGLDFQQVGIEAQNAAGEGSFRIIRISVMGRSDPAPNHATPAMWRDSIHSTREIVSAQCQGDLFAQTHNILFQAAFGIFLKVYF